MTDIEYVVMDPTGNITVLVETQVPEEKQPSVAKKIMEKEPSAEQVGFVSMLAGGIALRMAGGEFCGNASMSAAVLYAMKNDIREGEVKVHFSCLAKPVTVKVSSLPDGLMRGTVNMPSVLSIAETPVPGGRSYPVVAFSGISHVIVEEEMDTEEAERNAPLWCAHLGTEALGIMMYDPGTGNLRPLVYVPSADTLFWENSCASGTTAVGAYLAKRQGSVSLDLAQPGGTLHIDASPDGRLLLTGTVKTLHPGSISEDI